VGGNCKTHEDGNELFEVQVDVHAGGSSWNLCSYDRKKALCCQVRVAIPEPLTCDIDSCDIDYGLCSQTNKDEWGNHLEPRGAAVDEDEQGLAIVSRDLDLERRDGSKRPYKWVTSFGLVILQNSLTYPSPPRYMRRLRGGLIDLARAWVTRSQNCGSPGVHAQRIDQNQGAPDRTQVEHTIPLVTLSRFASVAQHGQMWAPRPVGFIDRRGREIGQAHPEGQLTNIPAAGNENFWRNVWNNANGLPAGLSPVTQNSPEQRRPVDRLFEALGSNSNPTHFTLLRTISTG
jgi:chitinase